MRKDIVSIILEKDGKVLVEKRKENKKTSPGVVIFPAGHVEYGETKEEALHREIFEELGLKIYNPQLIYEKDFECEESQRIFWYRCDKFEGKLQNNEAEELLWITPQQSDILTYDIDREALAIFFNR